MIILIQYSCNMYSIYLFVHPSLILSLHSSLALSSSFLLSPLSSLSMSLSLSGSSLSLSLCLTIPLSIYLSISLSFYLSRSLLIFSLYLIIFCVWNFAHDLDCSWRLRHRSTHTEETLGSTTIGCRGDRSQGRFRMKWG